MRLAIMASGSGSNFEAIVKACKEKKLQSSVEILIVDKKDAYVINRAKELNIHYKVLELKDFDSKEDYEKDIVKTFKNLRIDLVCLAGYMKIVSHTLLNSFEGKIINIHPSLLPKYPGKDGLEQALKANEENVGITIHYVNKDIDAGKIIKQISFSVVNKTKEEIVKELHYKEHLLYIDVLKTMEENYEKSIN